MLKVKVNTTKSIASNKQGREKESVQKAERDAHNNNIPIVIPQIPYRANTVYVDICGSNPSKMLSGGHCILQEFFLRGSNIDVSCGSIVGESKQHRFPHLY